MAYTTIKKPTDYFNTVLYTGNGVDDRSITGVGFQPDFTWIKSRTTTDYNTLFDVVRGVGKRIFSNANEVEDTTPDSLQAFESDGFEVGTNNGVNGNNYNFASWNWKANGAGSANTDGSISSTVSASATSGFSIVKWTNSTSNAGTIGHGLGVAPKMILVKTTSGTYNWYVYHKSIGAGNFLELNGTVGSQASANLFDNTEPTTSVFSTGTNPAFINSTMIAYCFAEKQGFSKFGSYAGNQNNDGTFVYLGFKPSFVMVKRYSAGNPTATNWVILDNKRDTENTVDKWLYANASDAEYTASSGETDFVSNGFKIRGTGSYYNDSGHNYIYMAFAEQPLVGDNPATAR